MVNNDKSKQGRYHLLAIFLIPGLLVSIFLSGSWIVPVVYVILAALIAYVVLKVL